MHDIRRAGPVMGALAATAALLLASGGAFADAPSARIRSTITAVTADTLSLKTNAGQMVDVKLTDKTGFAGATQAKITDIAPDTYIGVAAVPGEGMLRALEVTVFPNSMRGVGDGYYPWDLGTNGSMTNGAVGSLTGTSGRTVTVKYKGGEQQILIPADVPIVLLAPGTSALLKPGAHVVVFAPPATGEQTAAFVVVGEGSVVPPM